MIRRQLLNTLELVRPALADDNTIPMFTNFCFTGNTVYAYKDQLGIVAPCETGTAFACNGKTLIDLLKTSQAKEIEIELDDENVLLKAGRSRMKLPHSSDEDFLFDEPDEEDWQMIFDIDDALLRGIELCLITTTNDATMPSFNGIAVRSVDENILYSSDGDALSKFVLGGSSKDGDEYIQTVPTEFCESLLRICEKTGYRDGSLYINDEWAVAELGNDIKIYGRIIERNQDFDFEEQIANTLKSKIKYMSVPEGFNAALSRARVVADPESKATRLDVEGGVLRIITETHVGVVKDRIKVKYDDVVANVSAKLVQRSIAVADEMAILTNCTAYRQGDDYLLLMGNYND